MRSCISSITAWMCWTFSCCSPAGLSVSSRDQEGCVHICSSNSAPFWRREARPASVRRGDSSTFLHQSFSNVLLFGSKRCKCTNINTRKPTKRCYYINLSFKARTDSLQLLLQQLEVLLNGGSISWSHISTEHAQQTVQLLGQLKRKTQSFDSWPLAQILASSWNLLALVCEQCMECDPGL